MSSPRSTALMKVFVDLKNFELLLCQDGQPVRRYPVVDLREGLAAGTFSITEKLINPEPSLGTRWLGLNKPPLGIHGAAFDNGLEPCHGIRLDNPHLEDLYALIPLGTQVEIAKTPCEFQTISLPNQFGRFPATPLAFPVVPGPRSYIVQKGDTIWKLSRRFKIPMESILAANLLPDPNRLEPGQIITIPLPWPKK